MADVPSHNELVNIAEAAAKKAVEQTLTTLGFDLADPIRAQGQMAALRILAERVDDEEHQADQQFTRNLRKTFETVTETGIKSVVRWLVGGVLALLALGAAVYFKKPF
jgi:uncharacterized protein Yka (UPF0111/DUF47 family)